MKSLRWVCCLLVLSSPASGWAQGILIPAAFYPVQGAPFTLTFETRWDRLIGMGPTESTQRILRDSAGRQRYESPVVDGVPRSAIVGIYDVVDGKHISLDLNARTAVVGPMRVGRTVVIDLTAAPSQAPQTAAADQTLLGTTQVAGLEAWGQRTQKTTTRSDGAAVTQDRELWLSTTYRMPVMQVIRNPQGKTTQKIVSFEPGEPDPALFQIPPGFTVSDAPPPPEPAPGTVRVGGNVSAPRVLKTADPEFSNEARKKKIGGNVMVHLIVDENGLPQDVTVVRGVGYGLDEKAIETVKKYRFQPAMRAGVPVKVEINVDVNFQIF